METGKRGLPFSGFTPEEIKNVSWVFSDVDDTITDDGVLYSETLQAMEKLRAHGYSIILITGASCASSEVFLRQWPVEGVIAESGAYFIHWDRKDSDYMVYTPHPSINENVEILEKRSHLEYITRGLDFSSDQYGRRNDLAYDKAKMTEKEIDMLKRMLDSKGANWSESSIHINAWYGSYDKESALKYFMKEYFNLTEKDIKESGFYMGDSLNDQSLFRFFPLSVGMKSVGDNKDKFKHLPIYIVDEYGGRGFTKVASALLVD